MVWSGDASQRGALTPIRGPLCYAMPLSRRGMTELFRRKNGFRMSFIYCLVNWVKERGVENLKDIGQD